MVIDGAAVWARPRRSMVVPASALGVSGRFGVRGYVGAPEVFEGPGGPGGESRAATPPRFHLYARDLKAGELLNLRRKRLRLPHAVTLTDGPHGVAGDAVTGLWV
jgi:hypothetical protein